MLPSLVQLPHHPPYQSRAISADVAQNSGDDFFIVYPHPDQDLTGDDESFTYRIQPRYVWKSSSNSDDSSPLPTNIRLGLITNICKYIVNASHRLFDEEDPTEALGTAWRLASQTRTIVYYQTPAGITPEWKDSDGQLALDERPDDRDSYVDLLSWLTYEWMKLPEDYRAFSLVNIVYQTLPSEAWLGLSSDLRDMCGEDQECLTNNIDDQNPVVAKRLVDRLIKTADQHDQASYQNRSILRYWVRTAFDRVPPATWDAEWIQVGIFELMPGLMSAPRVPVTQYDRAFIEALRKILERAAAPDGAHYLQDQDEFRRFMQQSGIPGRRSKRHRS